jgi:zinc protease
MIVNALLTLRLTLMRLKLMRLQPRQTSSRFCRGALALLLTLLLGVGPAFPAQADVSPIALQPVAVPKTAAKHYTELQFAPLPEVQVPQYQSFQLANGLSVYLMEDHEWPLVSGTALIRTGDRLEPGSQTGLATLTGDLIRSGGTLKHPVDELNQLLEQRAAAVETSIDTVSGSASFRSLREDFPLVFDLFAEVIQQPAFAQERLDFSKAQQQGGIARRNDDPDDIASREFYKLVYGSDSPYARTIEYQTLAKINRAEVVRFYQQYIHPSRMILGIVGDFDPPQMRAAIEAKFGKWQPPQTPSPIALPKVRQANAGKLFLVNQPQLTQSSVLLGQLGGKLSDPDVFNLYVMNGVMNGLGGRLVNEVRSRLGLAYSVYASWSPQFDYPGLFIAGGQTRSDATVPFIKAIRNEIAKLRTQPVSAAELAYAKDSILNSFVFNFQDPAQTLSRVMRYAYFGYPKDFIFKYQQGIKAATAADVQRVAQTYLKPDNFVTLVVGNSTAIQPPLTELSPVTPIDISIPPPPAS